MTGHAWYVFIVIDYICWHVHSFVSSYCTDVVTIVNSSSIKLYRVNVMGPAKMNQLSEHAQITLNHKTSTNILSSFKYTVNTICI